MRSTLSEMLEIFVFERQISHAKQINLSVKITNSTECQLVGESSFP